MYKHLILLIIGGVFYSALYAQDNGEYHPDFEYVSESDPWLKSNNTSGLYTFSLNSVSYGELSFQKDDGKFINYYQSDNSYTYGGKAESFYRLSPKVVLYGKISYDNFKGKNMGGSSFIDPYYNPFDIVAEADTTKGEKQLERYHLIGAASFDIYKGLKLGAKLDYLAANYAKFKDLRHRNKLTDLSLTIGVSYSVNSFLEIGLNYFYRRSVEGILFSTYGNKDIQYYSLIDFGAFFGKREIFGDTGYTKKDDDKPMFNKYNGGSVELYFTLHSDIKFLNEFTYKSRDGYYGKKSSSTIVYTEHNSKIYEYKGIISLKTGKNQHHIEISAEKEKLENNESIYNVETSTGNNTTVIYYGSNRVLDQDRLTAKLAYTANLAVVNYHPVWVLKAGADYYQQKQTASLYPYYRKQTINITDLNISAKRNIFADNGQIYSIALGAGFSTGSGNDKNDGIYTYSEGGSSPATLDSSLYKEYEYLTSSQMRINVEFGYLRPINKDVSIYGNLQGRITKGFDIQYLPGSTFTSIGINLGCYF